MEIKRVTQNTLPDLMKEEGHKYDHGHALILSGPPGQTGAARLAARGALRVGAGLVTLACPLRARDEIAAQVTSIMVRSIDGPSGFDELLEDQRFNAICLGPGLGLSRITAEMVRVALASRRRAVLDADALTRFETAPDALFDQLHDQALLTPHWGEFRRLFPDIAAGAEGRQEAAELGAKPDAAMAAAKRAGCVILLKGPETVIADPAGNCSVHAAEGRRATPWLATAGAGDVLAGIITGLLARGYDVKQAAETGTWLHVEAARAFGPCLIAEDIPEMLPQVFRGLDNATDVMQNQGNY